MERRSVIALEPRILRLEEIRDESLRAVVGGKAAGLSRLIQAGLRVPPGFVVVDAQAGEMPPDLDEAYRSLGGGAVAVRSSAFGEDGQDASFAGQYETVLDVVGEEALREAISRCVESLTHARALAYQEGRAGTSSPPGAARMSVVVQTMVPARSAGVLFTVDPASQRRAHVVIDAVAGLGEALVSGHASPDHFIMSRCGELLAAELAGPRAVLGPATRERLVEEALEAERKLGGDPLDMEWAVDASGLVFWLQARPVTTLGPDLHELDTPLFDRRHVYTRCNVGEMFPGACTPLSFSFTARGIDRGLQMMQQAMGLVVGTSPHMRFIGMHAGHLFLNLSTMAETSSGALGSSTEDLALSVCGRPLTEVRLEAPPLPAWPRRLANGVRYARYLFGRGRARRDIARLAESLDFPDPPTAAELWRAIDARSDANDLAMHWHLISSASSGILTPTLIGVLAGGRTPTDDDQAEAAARLAGARDVESADIIVGAERIEDAILGQPDAEARFVDASPQAALAWLCDPESGAAQRAFSAYLERHGHRAIKELELRQPEWRHEPLPLVRSLQVALRGLRASGGQRPPRPALPEHVGDGFMLRWLTRLAREAVRSREETKSGLVAVAAAFKDAYRRLAQKMVAEGLLPDEDAVFFLTHDELGARIAGDARLEARAIDRRTVHEAQSRLRFPDVFVGLPEPLRPDAAARGDAVHGAPVSRGRVVGRVRIVRELAEAEALQPGEILVAPITDVGWTPYFSLIAGLVTDVGSAVSHGAVVAREYGLPAVVNTRFATDVFTTGDLVELDGDHGIVRRIEPEDRDAA
jgi:pyruvate,water dikinase